MSNIKTLVEMFDECQLENIISGLNFRPEKIIFIGYKNIMTDKKRKGLERFFKLKNISAKIEYITVERYNLEEIINKFIHIIKNNKDCVFDLTGGQELILTAMGIVAYDNNIPLMQFDIKENKFINVRNCNLSGADKKVSMIIREGIVLHGGEVEENENEWDLNNEFKSDIAKIWSVCKKDCTMWNKLSGLFSAMDSKDENIGELHVKIKLERLSEVHQSLIEETNIFREFLNLGLISDFRLNNNQLSFKYKSAQVRRCIIKAGNILELYTYMLAKDINREEQGIYSDIKIGVCVDWDGVLYDRGKYKRDTKNEIDVFLMRGLIPVFISCKNGEVQKESLYELSIVAEKFGGEYAKKILLATTLSSNPETKNSLLQRAKDMNITVLENVHNLNYDEFKSLLKQSTK